MSFLIRKKLPFLPVINAIAMEISERGFTSNWYKYLHKEQRLSVLKFIAPQNLETNRLGMNEYSVVFRALGIGLAISFVVFLAVSVAKKK